MSLFSRIFSRSSIDKAGSTTAIVIPGSFTETPRPRPFAEFGITGLQRTQGTGYVFEEWLAQLSGSKQNKIYREMRDNDPIIGAMFFTMEMILRRSEWHIDPAKHSGAAGRETADFVWSCKDDMSHTWEDFIAEVLSMLVFGYALFEVTYKRRKGAAGKHASNHDDGAIGWRKFAPRAQETIQNWQWDDEGGLIGVVQLAPPDYQVVAIPIEQLLLFRTTSNKQNPEGRSLLRNCFRTYLLKKRIEEVEAIGIERDLCGIPVLTATAEAIEAMGGVEVAKAMVRNIRVDDQMGIVLPASFDDKGNPNVKLELLRTAGAKQTNPSATVARYNADMLNTILAGFIQFGQAEFGSRAMHGSAKEIFVQALSAFMDSIAAVINRIAIPRLLAMNAIDLELAPRLTGEVGMRNLSEIADYVSRLSQAGLTFFDRETANLLRKFMGLPEEPEEMAGARVPGIERPRTAAAQEAVAAEGAEELETAV